MKSAYRRSGGDWDGSFEYPATCTDCALYGHVAKAHAGCAHTLGLLRNLELEFRTVHNWQMLKSGQTVLFSLTQSRVAQGWWPILKLPCYNPTALEIALIRPTMVSVESTPAEVMGALYPSCIAHPDDMRMIQRSGMRESRED